MTRIAFSSVLITFLASAVTAAEPSAETLRGYLTKSDVCLSGTFTLVIGVSTEQGVIHYHCELEVGQVIAGQCSEKKISVGFVRLELKPGDTLPFLKEGGKCLLFLKRITGQDTKFTLADSKWGIQEHSDQLARAIGTIQESRRNEPLAKDEPKAKAISPPEPAPVFDLTGKWLLTMPRGIEYEARLERLENGTKYRLVAGAANLRGTYELRDGRLSMIQPENERMTGLVWEIKNKNVVVLSEHPEESQFGSDYRNSTLSRSVLKLDRTP
ncbi:MAG: hypothetical protein ACR2FY_04055 [Pirellulaceae bacterium]